MSDDLKFVVRKLLADTQVLLELLKNEKLGYSAKFSSECLNEQINKFLNDNVEYKQQTNNSSFPSEIDFKVPFIKDDSIKMTFKKKALIDKKEKSVFGSKKTVYCSIDKINIKGFEFYAFIMRNEKKIKLNVPLIDWKCEVKDKILTFSFNNKDYELEDESNAHANDWVDSKQKLLKTQETTSVPIKPSISHNDEDVSISNDSNESKNNPFLSRKLQDEIKTSNVNKTQSNAVKLSDYLEPGAASNDVNSGEYDDTISVVKPSKNSFKDKKPKIEEPPSYEDFNNTKISIQYDNIDIYEDISNVYVNDDLDKKPFDYPIINKNLYLCLYNTNIYSSEYVLNIKRGDVVEMIENITTTFFVGKLNNEFGLVPHQHVIRIYY